MKPDSIVVAEPFLALLQEQIDNQPDAEPLISALQPLIDQYSDLELMGLADSLALFSEQLEQLDQIEDEAAPTLLLIDFHKALQDMISSPAPGVWQYLLACLSDSHWPEPLAEEDCEFLAELLELDCNKLQTLSGGLEGCAVKETKVEADTVETTLSPPVSPYLSALREVINGKPADVVDALHQLMDQAGEEDLSGFADLFALLAEIWETEEGGESLNALHQPLLSLLSSFKPEDADRLLSLMSEPCWQSPLPGDDRAFLAEILLPDLQQLASQNCDYRQIERNSCDDNPVVISDAISEVETDKTTDSFTTATPAEVPAFCPVDLTLLEQPGPELEPEVLAMLTNELQQLQDLWCQDLSDIDQLCNASLQQMTPIVRAMDSLHLLGAGFVVKGLQNNIRWLQDFPDQLQPRLQLLIANLLAELNGYLKDITDVKAQQALLDLLEVADLPASASEEQISFLAGLLALASLKSPDLLVQEQAASQDVELQVADDIDPQLLEMLFNELPQLSEILSEQLQNSSALNSASLREAQRAAHTIKGLANMAGIVGIANLTHRLEDILELFTEAEQLPGAELRNDLVAITDTIAIMCEAVVLQQSAPDSAQLMLQRLMDWHYRLRSEGLDSQPLQNTNTVAPPPISEDLPAFDQPEKELNGKKSTEQKLPEQTTFRVAQPILDNLLRLAGEGTTLNTQLDEEITQLRSYTRLSRDRQRALQRVLFELEQQLNEQFTLQPELQHEDDSFDPLEMDRYNEMHTSLSRLQEAAADIQEVEQSMERHIRRTSELHLAQSGIQKETLDRVLSTRLVEVKSISSRLQRVLRQACRSTGKQAELLLEGEHTRIDSNILNQLADPLMHIIRNAIDHGLESPQQRQQSGKPEQGQIRLRFILDNDLIRVTCSDDGAGINTGKVRQIAIQKGLIEANAQLGQQEIERLILIPGFSTRNEISQLSGRGIGMDVVHQQIMRLQGMLNIRSETGTGTTLELSMPSSSLMIKTLLVRVGKQIYALASHGLEQSIISLDGQLLNTDQGLLFEYQGEQYPAYALESLLSEPGHQYEQGQVHPVLLINLGQGERVAVMVREVIAHRELAFKQMGDYLPDIPGIPGLTILANGDTAAVIDLPARIRYKSIGQSNLSVPREIAPEHELPKLLVVDDSLSARSSLSVLLRDTGYEVSTAIDGLDAMNQIRKQRPDMVLTDLEMPRMSGMELTSMMRGREEMQDIPVLMITSRTTDRHRNEALNAGVSSFLTKPWTENMLLDQVSTLLQHEPSIT